MNGEVVLAVHTCVHHEYRRLNRRACSGLEYHRTDGESGRSTACQHFDIGLFPEFQYAIASVGNVNGKRFLGVVFHITEINVLPVNCQFGRAPWQDKIYYRCDDQQAAYAERNQTPRWLSSRLLSPRLLSPRLLSPRFFAHARTP
jgi:hypothetical protein